MHVMFLSLFNNTVQSDDFDRKLELNTEQEIAAYFTILILPWGD